jgi:hypothetical protein
MNGCLPQCSAPLSKNKRCPKFTIDEHKLHCVDHFKKAKAIYDDYHQVCSKLEHFSIEKSNKHKNWQEKQRYLHEYYCLLIRAYKGRKKHQEYAFVPVLRDKGHLEQIDIVQNNILNVEAELALLYRNSIPAKQSIVKPASSKNNPIHLNSNNQDRDANKEALLIAKQMADFKKQRLQDLKMENQTLKNYIQENQALEKKCKKNVNYCVDAIVSLLHGRQEFNLAWAMQQMIYTLLMIDYFETDYKPCLCDCCDGYKAIFVNMARQCHHYDHSFHEYLTQFHPENISTLRNILTKHRKAVKPIANDLLELYDSFDDWIFCEDAPQVYFNWSHVKKRLVLHFDDDEEDEDDYDEDEGDDDSDEPKGELLEEIAA